MKYPIWTLLIISFNCSCKENPNSPKDNGSTIPHQEVKKEDVVVSLPDYDTTQWMEITKAISGITLDIRYATSNNFTEKVIYECGRCFLRPEIAKKLIQLNVGIKKRYGYSLKVFDCYRPQPAQQKLWEIVPDARYVTPPKKGSMHNRGMAIDLTLLGNDGKELDMGTPYDFFGRAAHTDHTDLPEIVLQNRKILQSMMKEVGFKTIRTEWWHFSHQGEMWPLDDWEWKCE